MLNRKQIPVCKRCHRLIHSGAYDKMSLKDLAYDPRWANTIRPPKIKVKIDPSEEQSKEGKAKSGIQVPGHLETDTKQVQNV